MLFLRTDLFFIIGNDLTWQAEREREINEITSVRDKFCISSWLFTHFPTPIKQTGTDTRLTNYRDHREADTS